MAPRIHFLVTAELESSLEGSLLNGGISPEIPRERTLPYGYREDLRRRDGRVVTGTMVPAPVWLIEGAQRVILIDTGVGDVDEIDALHARHGTTRWIVERNKGQDLIAGLAQHGVRPSDVEVVVLTHLHFDHIGNNELFTRARFVVQRDELPQALCPPKFSMFYYPEYRYKMTSILDRLDVVDGDVDIDPDVRLLKIGGHTPGCQATLVNTSKGIVCLTSDTVYNYRNLECDWPVGSFWNLPELLRGMARMRHEADVLVPQHDWQFLREYPGGTIGDRSPGQT
jgi:glyoxylase-like metal-dependent hydrolase (beta-lactamase superfamily II)